MSTVTQHCKWLKLHGEKKNNLNTLIDVIKDVSSKTQPVITTQIPFKIFYIRNARVAVTDTPITTKGREFTISTKFPFCYKLQKQNYSIN